MANYVVNEENVKSIGLNIDVSELQRRLGVTS